MLAADKRSPVTTHVLDLQKGTPATGLNVRLEKKEGDAWKELAQAVTNEDGRIETLLQPGIRIEAGIYQLSFATGEYFKKIQMKSFYPLVCIVFEVVEDREHYHVPLLLSSYGYSTYRGT